MKPLTVWKFQWPQNMPDIAEFDMPAGAEILHVGHQEDRLTIWARVDSSEEKWRVTLHVAGTGHPCPAGRYLGTAHLYGGRLVLHVFEGERRWLQQ